MFRIYRAALAALILVVAPLALADGPLTLATAVQRALSQNPALQAGAQRIDASRGRLSQAGALPNPELGINLEDFAGNTGRSAGSATQVFSLSQRLELGGKRGARQSVASEAVQLSELDFQAQQLDVVTATRKAFLAVWLAERRLQLTTEQSRLANEVLTCVQARVTAGKVAPIEATRSEVAAQALARRARQAEANFAIARRQLATLWGGSPVVTEVSADYEQLPAVPAMADLEAGLDKSPELVAAQQVVAERQAQLGLTQSLSYPDVTVSVGTKRDATNFNEQSLLVGMSVPLPLFDRNQGERRAAHADLDAAQTDLQARRQQVSTELEQLYQSVSADRADAVGIHDQSLAAAEEAYRVAREGYQAGKFGLIDVLDAQRALADVRDAYLTSLEHFYGGLAELDRLLGRGLPTSPAQE